MKKLLLISFILFLAVFSNAQTNVSGGIYTNTTWTLANSPYIVLDTVVVFPGVTLTIQPGVVVEFANNKYLEIRQATLIADGTATDSITFTSNSLTPTPGIWGGAGWGGIWLNGYTANTNAIINFCNIKYATTAIYNYLQDTLYLKNSNINNNLTGLYATGYTIYIDSCNFTFNTNAGISRALDKINFCNISHNGIGVEDAGFREMSNCIIDSNQIGLDNLNNSNVHNCTINHNQKGIIFQSGYITVKNCIIDSNSIVGINNSGTEEDSVLNCEFKNNGIGIEDYSNINWPTIIAQCVIENNTTGIKLDGNGASIYCNKICNNTSYDLYYNVAHGSNYSLPYNLWCTSDSLSTEAVIYDGYDNISLGLVSFMPLDTDSCYLSGCNLILTPHSSVASCGSCHNGSASISIAHGTAPYFYTWLLSPIQTTATATGLAAGTYTVCITDGYGCTACNFNVVVDTSLCSGFSANATGGYATCMACNDGMATVLAAGGTPPYTYTWFSSPIQTTQTATGLSPAHGNYNVSVHDSNGCVTSDIATLGISPCSAYYIVNTDTAPHTYDLIHIASGVPPLTYDWNWGDGSPHDTAAYPNHAYSGSGNYTICLTMSDSAGCTSNYCHSFYLLSPMNSNSVYVNVIPPSTVGITTLTEKAFSVYPNPASSFLTLKSIYNLDRINVCSIDGRTVKSLLVGHSSLVNIDVSELSAGIYFIEVATGNEVSRQRFVKQ